MGGVTKAKKWIITFIALLCLSIGSTPSVNIEVYPFIGTSPQDLRVTITILPDPKNREFCLDLDSDTGINSRSCYQIDGEDHPKTQIRWIRGLTSGSYEVIGSLLQADGKIIRSIRKVEIT